MTYICAATKYIALLCILAVLWLSYDVYQSYTQKGPLTQDTIVLIKKGQSLRSIATDLAEQQILSKPYYFMINLKVRNKAKNIRAGEFKIPAFSSPEQVFDILHTGPFVHYPFTLPEGLTVAEVLIDLDNAEKMVKDPLPQIIEGSLHPETYHYVRDTKHSTLINRMKTQAAQALDNIWLKSTTKDIIKTPEELRTLASIVEKETALASERPRIAAVFINRLRKGMLLQSDPCVIYGLEQLRGQEIKSLTSLDLKVDTPFNTYLHPGLPPHPICNAGDAALEAVANPTETDELFFVADGTGGHVFAKTYEEHRKNHIKWRKIRKALQEKAKE